MLSKRKAQCVSAEDGINAFDSSYENVGEALLVYSKNNERRYINVPEHAFHLKPNEQMASIQSACCC